MGFESFDIDLSTGETTHLLGKVCRKRFETRGPGRNPRAGLQIDKEVHGISLEEEIEKFSSGDPT
jgi:hypothetical protein